VYRLDTLKELEEIKDFSQDLRELSLRLLVAESTRKNDDQEIIDVLNDVCFKMSKKF
jgi:hypothetical protein